MHPLMVHVRPHPCQEQATEVLIGKIWPTLHRRGFATDQLPLVVKISGTPIEYVGIYEWQSPDGLAEADGDEAVHRIFDQLRQVAEIQSVSGTYLDLDAI
ncbi:MAG: hypothetical protein M1600_07975 [Firmicutes bacterium]|jgi:hypothetical protein|nr:hypothetical protein [Bacillota bacterium]